MGKTEKLTEHQDISKTKDPLFSYDFPHIPITEATLKANEGREFSDNYRLQTGMVRTDKETEKYLKRSLKKKLP